MPPPGHAAAAAAMAPPSAAAGTRSSSADHHAATHGDGRSSLPGDGLHAGRRGRRRCPGRLQHGRISRGRRPGRLHHGGSGVHARNRALKSLVCILRNSVNDKTKVFEISGRSQFRAAGAYSFLFQEWDMPITNGTGTRETLRLDIIHRTFPRKNYYQEGDHVYNELDVHDAYWRALNTWAKWVDSNVDLKKTTVFFRGYSASHFSGGQWNSGSSCDHETEPITNECYLTPYPAKITILEEVLHGMKTPVLYLNITRMTDYRKEAHLMCTKTAATGAFLEYRTPGTSFFTHKF